MDVPMSMLSQLMRAKTISTILFDDLAVVNNRAGNKLREEGNKQGVGKKVSFFNLSRISINAISNLLECIK